MPTYVPTRWTISNGTCAASTDDITVTFYQAPTTATVGAGQNPIRYLPSNVCRSWRHAQLLWVQVHSRCIRFDWCFPQALPPYQIFHIHCQCRN
ncbi:MAG: hypothetical protein IPH84_18295 [Bacteroidales bacterium]|nr:hypothetical protein [Bacteroidales bacterium]